MISVGLDLFGLAARRRAFGPSLPLDSLSAAAAYSTRRLRSGYTGAAIRVRRSSDNTEADIGFTALGDLDTRALLAHAGENALLQSEDLSTAAWARSAGSSVAAAGTHNGSAAWRFTESAGNVRHRVNSTAFTRPASTAFVVRVRVKSEGRQFVQILFNVTISGLHQNFDLENLTSDGSAGLNPTITDVGDGWRELTLTYPAAASGSGSFFIGGASGLAMARDATYVGDGTSGFLIAQPQVTFGDVVKPYAPTGAAALVGGDGLVAAWYDQSGNARNAAQATADAQPRIVNAGVVDTIGGRPAMAFDGVDDQFVTPSWGNVPQPFTRSHVLRLPSTLIINRHVSNNAAGNVALYLATADSLGIFAGVVGPSMPVTSNQHITATSVFSGASSVLAVNGTASAAGNAGTNGQVGIRLGAFATSPAFLGASFQEFVLFPSALSTADRQTLERNQGAYYDVVVA
jgi:hypothetical protein